MNELLKMVLSLSLSGALLILVLFLCKPVIKNKLSKRWQYYIWLIVVARLLLPFAPETNLMSTLFQHFGNTAVQADERLQSQRINPELPETDSADSDKQAGATRGENLKSEKQQPNRFHITLQNIGAIGLLIWLTVAAGLMIRKVTVYQSFIKYINAGRLEVSNLELWERVGKLVEQTGVKGAVGLYTNSLISSPLLIGFFRPCIMLPTTQLSDSDFEYTILHELTHYKRRDMFYKWLVQFTVCLHWFNPLIYLMSREVGRACELSCDEAVIRTLDSAGRRAYGDTLLNAMGAGGSYKNSLASVTLTEGAELLKERLSAIMAFKKKSALTVFTTVLLTFAFGFGAMAAGVYAVSPFPNRLTGQERPQPVSYVIECVSEKIILKQGGTAFKIEVDPASQGNYTVRDNRNVPMGERYYRYNKWDIVFSRTSELPASAIYSSTVILTIPESLMEQELYLVTSSGNILIDGLDHVNLTIESEDGSISIENTKATDISAKSENGNVQLAHTISTGDIIARSDNGIVSIELDDSNIQYSVKVSAEPTASITVNGKQYSGGEYTIGAGGKQTITLDGEHNTFLLSNINLFHTAVSDALVTGSSLDAEETEGVWTEDAFIGFMQEQERQYKALLASGSITQQEYDTFIAADKAVLKEIKNGAKISKSATGSIANGIGA